MALRWRLNFKHRKGRKMGKKELLPNCTSLGGIPEGRRNKNEKGRGSKPKKKTPKTPPPPPPNLHPSVTKTERRGERIWPDKGGGKGGGKVQKKKKILIKICGFTWEVMGHRDGGGPPGE